MKVIVKPKYDNCDGLVLEVYKPGKDKPSFTINVEDVIVGNAQKTLDQRRRIYYIEREHFNQITDSLRSIADKHEDVTSKIWDRYYF